MNGDQLLEQHINQNPLNAQYTSRFSASMLIEAIDTWLDRKLLKSLKSSPYFTIMAESVRISLHKRNCQSASDG